VSLQTSANKPISDQKIPETRLIFCRNQTAIHARAACSRPLVVDIELDKAGMKMLRVLGNAALCSALGGCGIAARVDSRNEYQASAANYKACLSANPSAPKSCESFRLIMETDERKYNDLSAGLNPGSQRADTVTILNR
jgi:hypothetical protein